ncbi:DUF2971 domain-containing protein [Dietzia maris]|uniref:DUF2971 domain-containing protein n=1 Tax=Dietzia maris TaxID=37915 RepID=UPI00232FA671|nr:DUF2971 domain-containing protein [Dietzia maris]
MPEQDVAKRPIYHYTDAAGLRGILQTGRIWATHTDFLNDAAELEFATIKLKDALREQIDLVEGLDESHEQGGSREVALYFMREFVENLNGTVGGNVYVSSFSLDGDSLAQWRAYAPAGYAIEFDEMDFFSLDPEEHEKALGIVPGGYPQGRWKEIAYGLEAAAYATTLAKGARDHYLSTLPSGNSGVHVHAAMAGFFADDLPLMKHPSFSGEREQRLVIDRRAASVLFRDTNQAMGPIPYVEVPFHKNSIKGVIVGPGPNQELRARSVSILLNSIFGEDSWRKHVEVSDSPARS